MRGQVASHRSRNRLLGTVGSAALLALGVLQGVGDAQARQAGPTPPAAQGLGQLEEISVTARRREENILEVPVAVSTITPVELERANIVRMEDLSFVEPGLTLTVGTIFPYAFIRGFGTGGTNELEQSLGKFVDNVTYPRDQDILIPLFDVERVEVLKGPQVLLYGNSATAGAINITNRKPGTEFESNVSTSYEFIREELQLQGGITVPFSDKASFRVAGFYQDLNKPDTKNIFLDEGRPTYDNWAIRPWLRLWLTPELTVDLHGEYDKIRTYGGSLQETTQPLSPAITPFLVVGRGDLKYLAEGAAPFYTFDGSGLDHELYQADINYDVFGGTFTSTTAFRRLDAMSVLTLGPIDPHFLTYTFQRYNQFSQELRFNGSYNLVDVTVGGFYQRGRHRVGDVSGFNLGALGLMGLPATPFGSITKNNVVAETYSGFGELGWKVTDALTVSVGARYTHLEKEGSQERDAGNVPTNVGFHTGLNVEQFSNPALVPVAQAILGSSLTDFPFGALNRTENYVQPQAVVQYQLDDNNMVYAKYVEGAKAGGFDFSFGGTNPEDAEFEEETAESFEIGAKGQLLNNTLVYTLAAYQVTFTDLQTAVFNQNTLILSNVGEASSEGVELGLTYLAREGLTLGANVNYMDATYDEYPGAACNHIQNFIQGRGCRQDLSGAPTRFSSKWTGALTANYQTYMSGLIVETGARIYARSEYNAGDANDPDQVQDAFAQFDAHLTVGPEDDGWSIMLFGRNLSDERVLMFGGNTPLNGTSTLSNVSPGRQFGIKLSAQF